jgi:hypothetical protein
MSVTVESGLDRLKKLGQRLLANSGPKVNVKAQPIPVGVAERRSGRRVALPLEIRVKLSEDDDPRNAQLRDVNVSGLAIEPSLDVVVDDRVNVGFDGYPGVCPAFALVASVKRIVDSGVPGEPTAMGLEIDREATSADAQKNFKTLVRHYLHHRPLLGAVGEGFIEGRCTSCDWVGRTGKRRPRCPRCASRVVPVDDVA